MVTQLTQANWLEALRTLMPPRGLLHVGAGNGSSSIPYTDWDVERLFLIDADESSLPALKKITDPHIGWESHALLLGDKTAETSFYIASNPAESGLLPAESWSKIWRNLSCREERHLPQQLLDTFIQEANAEINWLVLACLPALPLLEGAQETLQQCDVLVIRTQLEGCMPSADKSAIDSHLAKHSLFPQAVWLERNPKVGMVLYIRDQAARLAHEQEHIIQLSAANIALQEQLEAQRKSLAALELSKASLQKQLQDELDLAEQLRAKHHTIEVDLQHQLNKQKNSLLELEKNIEHKYVQRNIFDECKSKKHELENSVEKKIIEIDALKTTIEKLKSSLEEKERFIIEVNFRSNLIDMELTSITEQIDFINSAVVN
ncbi:hypothetical protein NT239_04790 [Chitinibacter sp. SCUT-21]|uniref:hypothetical protein n=1 Tax=Chitinibacter sp. SCUT-21 TaxID=2970891 RepID=UPI0035A5C8D8